MRRKAGQGSAAADLRLVVNKPEPETISKETEALTKILDNGVSYDRQLCIDCVGGERAKETVRFKIILIGADNPLSAHIAKQKLQAFLTKYLGTRISDIEANGDELIEALHAAEDANLIRMKQAK